jgi:hypothetical protein
MPLSALWTVQSNTVLESDATSCILQGSLPPNEPVGQLKYRWEVVDHPASGPGETKGNVGDSSMIASDMIGGKWRFKLVIEAAIDLAVNFAGVYCQYMFYGQVFTSEVVESTTQLERTLEFGYSSVHGMDTTTSQFVDYMQQESIEIKIVGKVRPQHVPTDEISTANKIVAHNINNIFSIVDDLADGDNPLSDAERERAIQEIENHLSLNDSVKNATIQALKRCKTVRQKRGIMSSARFGGTAEDIEAISKKNLTRRDSQKSLNRVRSLVKMVGEYRKEEHETELEEILVKREVDRKSVV